MLVYVLVIDLGIGDLAQRDKFKCPAFNMDNPAVSVTQGST